MKLINKSLNNFTHTINGKVYFLAVGSTLDVPEEIANLWLKLGGVEQAFDVVEVEKMKADLELFKLKEKATKLGIKAGNMKAETLAKKIAEKEAETK